jgi:hypothetical protein
MGMVCGGDADGLALTDFDPYKEKRLVPCAPFIVAFTEHNAMATGSGSTNMPISN